MVGACAGCPSSTATLKGGIEKMLTYYVKEIKEVIAEDDWNPDDSLLKYMQ